MSTVYSKKSFNIKVTWKKIDNLIKNKNYKHFPQQNVYCGQCLKLTLKSSIYLFFSPTFSSSWPHLLSVYISGTHSKIGEVIFILVYAFVNCRYVLADN